MESLLIGLGLAEELLDCLVEEKLGKILNGILLLFSFVPRFLVSKLEHQLVAN